MPGPATLFDTNVILKALIDTLWNASFDDVFGSFKWETKSRLNVDIDQEVLEQVEERKKEQKTKSLSREQVRLSEFAQVVSGQLQPIFTDLLNKWHIQHRFPKGLKAVLNDLKVVMDTAVKDFKTRTLGRLLLCVTIPVELYTLYETDYHNKTPLTTNDWVDWNHAAAALAYCDMNGILHISFARNSGLTSNTGVK